MLTQSDHSIIKKAYEAFKTGVRQWVAPDFGSNLSPEEIAHLRDELVVSIQYAYVQAEKSISNGTKFAQVRFTQWVGERYDVFVLNPKELEEKRAWQAHRNKLQCAIRKNNIQQVQHLIDNRPACTNQNWQDHVYFSSLLTAVDVESVKIVELLLPFGDPKTRDSWVLQTSAIKNHDQLMDVLYDVCEPHKALEVLRTKHPEDYSKWQALEQRIEAKRLHEVLTQHLPVLKNTARKM